MTSEQVIQELPGSDASAAGRDAAVLPWRRYVIGALLAVAATGVTFSIMLPRGVGLNPNFGIWSAMALDLVDGVLYRPVFSEMGYGGTRYFPVLFSLQAAFIQLTGNVLVSGYCVVACAAMLLFAGLYTLLRGLDVPRHLAACGVAFALASIAVQIGLITFQGDLLPAAFNICGLAAIVAAVNRHRALLALACLFFALAFLSKITSVFGAGAAFLWLVSRREFVSAGLLAAGTAAGMAAGLGAAYVFSDGRIVDAFQAVATGGMTLDDFIRYPWMLVRSLAVDLPSTVIIGCALAGLIALPKQARWQLPTFMFVLTGIITAGLYLSPGVEFNHLVDIHVASVTFLVVNVARQSWPRRMPRALPVCVGVSAVLVMVWNGIWMFYVPDSFRLSDRREVLAAVPEGEGPVLSEDPLLLSMQGVRPYMLDAFALHQVVEHDPRVKDDLFAKLESRAFRGVILGPIPYFQHQTLDFELKGKPFYGGFQFCEGFLDQLRAHYDPVLHTDLYVVFAPKAADVADASDDGVPVR